MEAWRGTDKIKAVNSVVKVNDPDKLALIAREAPDPLVRQAAANRRERILESRVPLGEGEGCPVCGAPLVNVEYYSAKKGAPVVTDVKTDWASMKKTTTYKIPYHDIKPHTAVFCPNCAHLKVRKIRMIALALLLAGLAVLVTGFILLGTGSDVAGILTAAAGALLLYIAYRVPGSTSGLENIKKGDPYITNRQLGSEEMKNYVSVLYIRMTPADQIPKAEGNTVALSRGMVREG